MEKPCKIRGLKGGGLAKGVTFCTWKYFYFCVQNLLWNQITSILSSSKLWQGTCEK